MYRIGARATFRHHARAEEALQHSSLIATEELTELLKPVVPCPSNIFRCDTRPAKPLDLCLVDLYQNPDLSGFFATSFLGLEVHTEDQVRRQHGLQHSV